MRALLPPALSVAVSMCHVARRARSVVVEIGILSTKSFLSMLLSRPSKLGATVNTTVVVSCWPSCIWYCSSQQLRNMTERKHEPAVAALSIYVKRADRLHKGTPQREHWGEAIEKTRVEDHEGATRPS